MQSVHHPCCVRTHVICQAGFGWAFLERDRELAQKREEALRVVVALLDAALSALQGTTPEWETLLRDQLREIDEQHLTVIALQRERYQLNVAYQVPLGSCVRRALWSGCAMGRVQADLLLARDAMVRNARLYREMGLAMRALTLDAVPAAATDAGDSDTHRHTPCLHVWFPAFRML